MELFPGVIECESPLVPTIKEAVVYLYELLMALEKVVHQIIYLRDIGILDIHMGFEKVLFVSGSFHHLYLRFINRCLRNCIIVDFVPAGIALILSRHFKRNEIKWRAQIAMIGHPASTAFYCRSNVAAPVAH